MFHSATKNLVYFVLPQSFKHTNFCADSDTNSSSFGACDTVSSSTLQIKHNALSVLDIINIMH